jgi:hypothetical protein
VTLKVREVCDGFKEMDHLFGTFGKAATFKVIEFITTTLAG